MYFNSINHKIILFYGSEYLRVVLCWGMEESQKTKQPNNRTKIQPTHFSFCEIEKRMIIIFGKEKEKFKLKRKKKN